MWQCNAPKTARVACFNIHKQFQICTARPKSHINFNKINLSAHKNRERRREAEREKEREWERKMYCRVYDGSKLVAKLIALYLSNVFWNLSNSVKSKNSVEYMYIRELGPLHKAQCTMYNEFHVEVGNRVNVPPPPPPPSPSIICCRSTKIHFTDCGYIRPSVWCNEWMCLCACGVPSHILYIKLTYYRFSMKFSGFHRFLLLFFFSFGTQNASSNGWLTAAAALLPSFCILHTSTYYTIR